MKECTVAQPQTIYQLEKTGIWGEAVRQARPIMVNDFAAPNPLKKGLPEGHSKLHKYLTIPVFSEGRIVAVVAVANKSDDYNAVSYTHLTLPTICSVQISVVAVSLKKKKKIQKIRYKTEKEQKTQIDSNYYTSVSKSKRQRRRHI
eukprot:TRINITY_DN8584_c0_g1_i1.p1 TRINITY_DN8584_c0_g1~~TRINITY_DN8584_c0_g1_i1.p1  ORF type:complete len:146 (+),score=17.25 TRINITY_DN8584_c0_g1_i1:302-739(+)